ncbi:uncharacterized protein LOC119709997 [Motacilla alba alba]|uniref:uncharacterized protein LOC119709997 n=1 Tax=Motacilla alba alba TaxID=1094192 RepID=UPI0018D4EC75|nr:uncharacterized protein LOC119709997 [Motacilla alba alba]
MTLAVSAVPKAAAKRSPSRSPQPEPGSNLKPYRSVTSGPCPSESPLAFDQSYRPVALRPRPLHLRVVTKASSICSGPRCAVTELLLAVGEWAGLSRLYKWPRAGRARRARGGGRGGRSSAPSAPRRRSLGAARASQRRDPAATGHGGVCAVLGREVGAPFVAARGSLRRRRCLPRPQIGEGQSAGRPRSKRDRENAGPAKSKKDGEHPRPVKGKQGKRRRGSSRKRMGTETTPSLAKVRRIEQLPIILQAETEQDTSFPSIPQGERDGDPSSTAPPSPAPVDEAK